MDVRDLTIDTCTFTTVSAADFGSAIFLRDSHGDVLFEDNTIQCKASTDYSFSTV